MHHDLARQRRSGPLLGGRARQKRHPLHQVHQPVVIAGDEAFREDDRGNRASARMRVAHLSDSRSRPSRYTLNPPRRGNRKDCTRLCMKRCQLAMTWNGRADFAGEQSQNHGIAGPAVVGGQQNAAPGIQGSDQTLRAHDSHDVTPKLLRR